MWRCTTFAFGLAIVSCTASPAVAQSDPGSLIRRTNWVQFEMVLGRMTALAAGSPQRRSHSSIDPLTGCGESLTVSAAAGSVACSYEFVSEREHWKVDVVDGNEVSVSRLPRNGANVVFVNFHQPARGAVTLAVGAGQERQDYTSAGLWHLLLAESQVCQENLIPILESLRPSWRLAETAEEIEEALFHAAGSGQMPSRERLLSLVKQLGSGSFQRRQQADRDLRRLGPATISFLSNLEKLDLDAEQRLRLKKMLQDLSVQSGDSPERVASWLCDDKQIWLTLLNRNSLPDRQAAAEHLARIAQATIDFDPSAAPQEREAQIARIRLLITVK